MENIYSNPEASGLTVAKSYDISQHGSDTNYELIVIFRKEENYYLGTDSGCSCPTPFESYTFEDLTGPLTKEQAYEEYDSLVAARMKNVKIY